MLYLVLTTLTCLHSSTETAHKEIWGQKKTFVRKASGDIVHGAEEFAFVFTFSCFFCPLQLALVVNRRGPLFLSEIQVTVATSSK